MAKKNEAETASGQGEALYTAAEFASAADAVFGAGTSPDIVRAAFWKAGKEVATVQEAKKLVEAFAKKEVK